MSDRDRSFLDHTDEQIREEVIRIGEVKTRISNRRTVGVGRGLLEASVLLAGRVYRAILRPMLRQLDRRHATGFWLELHGVTVGLRPIAAQRATGVLTVAATAEGTIADGAAVVAVGTGLRYLVTAETTFQAGEAELPVQAVETGTRHNIASGAELELAAPNGAVESVVAGDDWLVVPGADDENDDQFRERIDARWLSLSDGNPSARYVLVARSVAGVVRATVVPTPRGYGSTDVIIASASGPPTEEQITAVEDALDAHGLTCRDLVVRGPIEVPLTVQISFAGGPPDAAELLRHWIATRPIGKTLRVRDLYVEPWIDRPAFDRLEIIARVRDVVLAPRQIIVPTVEPV